MSQVYTLNNKNGKASKSSLISKQPNQFFYVDSIFSLQNSRFSFQFMYVDYHIGLLYGLGFGIAKFTGYFVYFKIL